MSSPFSEEATFVEKMRELGAVLVRVGDIQVEFLGSTGIHEQTPDLGPFLPPNLDDDDSEIPYASS